MTLSIEHNYRQVLYVPAQSPGNIAQVVFHRRVDINHSARGWADYNLVHIDVRRVQQTAALSGGQNGDRVVGSQSAKVRSFQRIDCNIDFRAGGGHFVADTKAA